MVRLRKDVPTKQRKTTPTQTLQFHISLRACPASSASIECIFSIYDLVCSKIRKSLDVKKAEKLVNIYRLCRAEEDNHLNLLKLFEVIYISLLFVLFD